MDSGRLPAGCRSDVCGRVDHRADALTVIYVIYGLCALVSVAGSLLLAYWVLIKMTENVIRRRMS